ncbi:hypothetical protein OAV62_01890 [bacterium]|nr:hypothetical protein [bacterium]
MSLLNFLTDNGFYTKRWLRLDDTIFLEILSSRRAVPILLAVPNSFDQEVTQNYIQLTPENITPQTDSVEDYTRTSEPFIEQTYNNITHHIDIPVQHKKPMSFHLQTSYKHPVVMEDKAEEFEFTKKLITRQMGRLKYCIQGIPQRIGCINSTLCCYLSFTDNQIKMFKSTMPLRSQKGSKLYVVIELSVFHDKIDSIENEAEQILNGVYKILTHTQTSHVENIGKLIARLPTIQTTSDKLLNYKKKYVKHIDQYIDLLSKWTDKQEKAEMEMSIATEQLPSSIRHDMQRNHAIDKLSSRIDQCKKTRREIIETIEKIRSDNEHLSLDLDYILFDNIVMIDKTLQNFEYLTKLEKTLRA